MVRMRSNLLDRLHERPELSPIDSDINELLIAWFNRGFLVLERVNWDSSARVLEKIIEYEAVHEINGWDDLHGRLRQDRRLFAFFHPAMPDDPVIFIEARAPLWPRKLEKLHFDNGIVTVDFHIMRCPDGIAVLVIAEIGNSKPVAALSFDDFDIKALARSVKICPLAGGPSIRQDEIGKHTGADGPGQ